MTLRRDFLCLTAGAVAAGTVVPFVARAEPIGPEIQRVHPDAALLAACGAFMEANRLYDACNDPSNGISEGEGDRRHDLWHETLDLVTETPATTPEGIRAKAAAMIAAFEMDVPQAIGDTVEDCADYAVLMAWRLAHDILAFDTASA